MSDKTQGSSGSEHQKAPETIDDKGDAEQKHPVDVGTQEEAAKERSENGGYD